MRALAQKPDQPQKALSHGPARPTRETSGRDRAASSTLLLQLAMGTAQRAPQTRGEELRAGARDSASPGSAPQSTSIAAAPGELEQPPFRISARPPATLPASTAAWTQDGEIHVGPAGLLLPAEERGRMLRHEAFHRLHQRAAPLSDAPAARAGAERLAAAAESDRSGGLAVPTAPAPALLAFPPQVYPPWDQVYLGYNHIIGEVVEKGVTARILLSYADLGITRSPEPDHYNCGKHPAKAVEKTLAARMRKAAKQAAELNSRTPASFPLKTAVVAISKGANSGFRQTAGQGVIVVKQEEPWEGTIAHEGAHSIFAFHLGETQPSPVHDPMAKGIAELFLEASNTTPVSMPTRPFNPKRLPPLKDDGRTVAKPAGIVMVMDVLWAGKGSSPGHPWDFADEFFASAYGAFRHDRPLFEKILAHYGKADPKIPPLATRLLDLLGKVGNQTAIAALPGPANPAAVDAELGRIQPTPQLDPSTDITSIRLVDPTTLPGPAALSSCPGARRTPVPAPTTGPGAQPDGE